jgi:nuclear pore complex protein Nup210
MVLLIPWLIWKQRNECVFDGVQPSISRLITRIKKEATLWARAGAEALRVLLPMTFDVH